MRLKSEDRRLETGDFKPMTVADDRRPMTVADDRRPETLNI
ncbi:hypothetical protein [Limibacterium fermenti]